MLAASLAQAEEVTVFGYGKDFDQALRSAKIAALEQVTGTWISSEHEFRNGRYSEDIVQYNGGVIKSYKVKSYDGEKIEIVADVDVIKDNRVGSSGKYVPNEMRNKLDRLEAKSDEIALAMYNLDNPSKALYTELQNIEYINKGNITEVKVTAVIKWSPKWYTDIYKLSQTIGRSRSPDYAVGNKISGGITSSMMAYNPLIAATFGMVTNTPEPSYKDSQMLCFATSKKVIADDCYETGYEMSRFPSRLNMELWGLDGTNLVTKNGFAIDTSNLYSKIYPGDTKSHRNTNAISGKYYQPGYALYSNGYEKFEVVFKVQTSKLKQVSKFNFVIL